MNIPTLHLLMGLPGSGKTTLAYVLQEITAGGRLSSDDLRRALFPKSTFTPTEHDTLYKILDQSVNTLIASGYDVIYDANLNRREHRIEKYELARSLNIPVKLWWVRVPDTLARARRLSEQDPALLPSGETPENMFDRIQAVFEAPSPEEQPIPVDGTIITIDYIQKLLSKK